MISYHFHPSRKARERYGFDDSFFSLRGTVVSGSMRKAQILAQSINGTRKRLGGKSAPIQPAELYAAGFLHELYHYVIRLYEQQVRPDVLAMCEKALNGAHTSEKVDKLLNTFVNDFPPPSVFRGTETPEEYLQGASPSEQLVQVQHRTIALEEMMLVWIENQNPALASIHELIDDAELASKGIYRGAVDTVDRFFETQPAFGPEKMPLFKMLMLPILRAPDSLMAQLEFIRVHWEEILAGSPLFDELLRSQDFLKEEGKYLYMLSEMEARAKADREKMPSVVQPWYYGWGDKGSAPVTEFKGDYYESEPERFSADLNWMPRLVLIAKTSYVWLDQLSKKYQRHISRLDQIPDEELDVLASRGFTGLWLIGLWKRSFASQRIKHLHGNIDAVASAYSLDDYDISPDFGGEEAYRNLRDRAMRRGIRLASDMVPNHMGVDSRWVIQHPDWFIKSPYPPYPNYSYTGPDVGSDERVGIFIEDGYWSKSDAAVAFKRLDRWTGDVRYIYHGNDGTNMPWNDTAQLNFLMPEVREAVIQTILHVARLFPIIRFDAAMTLAKKHFQRLWYPQPGTGGSIPSRTNYSMSKEEFDSHIPHEFWREVVDRVQQEAPDTLLLAEAFWLMEGYFVRTLGMHRVYNSAFMNMLKKEENANFRTTIKNVLEYNPQILKRHVNFMNNPDEDTAEAQFGKDDKYFGVCLLMATMPGLPMFGHGQIEGYTEKYGHEFRRAYREEQPDGNLIARHEREIFPILKKRYLFSDVENFLLYDVFTADGFVNEDVFAFSNRYNGERGLVVYNNRFAHAAGWVRTSVGFLSHEGAIVQKTLAEGLTLSYQPDTYLVFRDQISGLEYIRSNRELIERGMFIDLEAFKYCVYIDFREVQPSIEKPYDKLEQFLNGRGVPSIEDEVIDLRLAPIHNALRAALAPEPLRALVAAIGDRTRANEGASQFRQSVQSLIAAAKKLGDGAWIHEKDGNELKIASDLLRIVGTDDEENLWRSVICEYLPVADNPQLSGWRIVFPWLLLHRAASGDGKGVNENLTWRWRLEKSIIFSYQNLGVDYGRAKYEVDLLAALTEPAMDSYICSVDNFESWFGIGFSNERLKQFLEVHTYEEVEYFNKEKFEELFHWIFILRSLFLVSEDMKKNESALSNLYSETQKSIQLAASAGYKVSDFLNPLEKSKKVGSDSTAARKPIQKLKNN
jgi:glycosidase